MSVDFNRAPRFQSGFQLLRFSFKAQRLFARNNLSVLSESASEVNWLAIVFDVYLTFLQLMQRFALEVATHYYAGYTRKQDVTIFT
jgi:hypothetical protein